MKGSRQVTVVGTLLAFQGFACSGTVNDAVPSPEPSRTHAIISLEQQQSASPEAAPETVLMLGMLRVPQSVDSSRLLRLIGLNDVLPEVGHCELVDSNQQITPALATLERVELLDVGDVNVMTRGKYQRLLRQAFPTVTDFMSGVIYTTRDNPSEFSIESNLVLRARGNANIPAFTVTTYTVPPPQRLTIDNNPFGEWTRQSILSNFELKWEKGRPEDLIWVELEVTKGRRSLSCVYADRQGYGVIPGMQLNSIGEGRFVVHRVSKQDIVINGVDRAEVRFDVRITQPIQLF